MLFVGDGWGKSAAAFGYAMRSAGRGWSTVVVQFLKGGAWNAAEIECGRRLGIEWLVFTPALSWGNDDPARLGAIAWQRSQELIESGGQGLIVLDEITHAIQSGWVEEAAIVGALHRRPPTTSIILTGRDATPQLRAAADTITGFELVKHHEKRGVLG